MRIPGTREGLEYKSVFDPCLRQALNLCKSTFYYSFIFLSCTELLGLIPRSLAMHPEYGVIRTLLMKKELQLDCNSFYYQLSC